MLAEIWIFLSVFQIICDNNNKGRISRKMLLKMSFITSAEVCFHFDAEFNTSLLLIVGTSNSKIDSFRKKYYYWCLLFWHFLFSFEDNLLKIFYFLISVQHSTKRYSICLQINFSQKYFPCINFIHLVVRSVFLNRCVVRC